MTSNTTARSVSQTNTTYHMYQQVWPVGDNSKGVRVIRPRKKTPKTKTGCMNCKKRRKKCDEAKPTCTRCTNSKLECFWPGHVVKLYKVNNNGVVLAAEPLNDTTSSVDTTSKSQDKDKITTSDPIINHGTDTLAKNEVESSSSQPEKQQSITTKPQVVTSQPTQQQSQPLIQTANNQQQLQCQSLKDENPAFDLHQFMDGFTMDSDLFDIDLTNSDYLLDQFLLIQHENKTHGPPSSQASSSVAKRTNISGSVPTTANAFEASMLDNPLYDIPCIEMSKYDKVCYSHFIDKFMLTITPPHCNPLITPIKILLPFLISNDIVREIFLSCGASFHAFENDEYVKRASDRYVNSVNLLIHEIQESKYGAEDHLFICAQLLQTLCLRDKNIGSNATKCAAHLSASYEIIKKRFIKNSINLQNFNMTPLDRILSEHFVFNYPITILLCHSDKLFKNIIPSPFQFFDQFNDILNKPFSPGNTNPWLNHPVMGVSLKAYEIASKSSWICRFFRKSMELAPDREVLKKRYGELSMRMKTDCLEDLKKLEDLSKQADLKDSQKLNISISKTAQLANLMIIKKLCIEMTSNPSQALDVTKECEEIESETRYSYTLSPNPFLDDWTVFVCGVLTTDKKIRKLIEDCFILKAVSANSSLSLKILKFLKVFWEDSNADGFEVLFDGSTLNTICV